MKLALGILSITFTFAALAGGPSQPVDSTVMCSLLAVVFGFACMLHEERE